MDSATSYVENCEDLIEQILINLPAKSLIRFKQVSKRWLERINSFRFSKKHYNSIASKQHKHSEASIFIVRSFFTDTVNKGLRFITNISINKLAFSMQYENICVPYLEITDHMSQIDILNSPMFPVGLGLYCLFKFPSMEVALWNPTTCEIKVLPCLPFNVPNGRRFFWGFGHAEIKDDTALSYKIGIVSTESIFWPCSLVLYLYSSASDSWKLLTNSQIGFEMNWLGNCINFKGRVYLLSGWIRKGQYIITFDYASEAFGTIEIPKLSSDAIFSCLTLYDDDTLGLFQYRTKHGEVQSSEVEVFYDLWVMREYAVKESWCKVCTFGPFNMRVRILGYWKSLSGILLSCFDNKTRVTRLYLSKRGSSELVDLSIGSINFEPMYAYERVDSVVSINGTPHPPRQKFSPGHASESSLR